MFDMAEKYFLGVDVGGTKTHALIADDQGRALGFGEAGPGNHQSVGYEGLKEALQAAVGQALRSAALDVDQIAASGFGIGGFDWPSQLDHHLRAIAPLGLHCPVDVANDSIIALMAGASRGWGIVLIAGTGNNCRGRDSRGREARITGGGWTVWRIRRCRRYGREGSSSHFLRMDAARAEDILNWPVYRAGGAKNLSALIEGIDLGCYELDASWAPVIFEATQNGDRVAGVIITWSARELGESACAVIRQLRIGRQEFDVILAGSVFAGGDLYFEPLRATIYRKAQKARLIKLEAPPVAGGAELGMQKAGLDTTIIHQNMITSTHRFIGDGLQG